MNLQYTNWQAIFFDFLVGGLVILVLFRLFQFILPVFLARNKKNRSVFRVLPVVETVSWLFFLSWYTFRFTEIKSLYAFVVIGILLILIFWISRYFLKDLMAGMFFRTSGRFKEGEVIVHKKSKGVIKKFGIQSLEIESQEGQIIYIPYSKLMDSLTIKSESTEQSAAYTFVFNILCTLSQEDSIGEIRSFLISLPWSSVQKIPVVIIREHTESHYTVEVTVYPIEKTYGKKIEQLTLENFLKNE